MDGVAMEHSYSHISAEERVRETREKFNKLADRQPRFQSGYKHHAAFYARLVRSAI